MSFKVQVGPPQIAIHQGQTVLVTEPDGRIPWPSDKGLYFLDTRIISNWAIYANGETWELLNGGPISYYAARIFLTNRSILTADGPIPPRMLGLTISRSISGGMHEDLDITNYSMKAVRFQLEVAFRSDFADVFEVKSGRIVRRGQITTEWSERRQRVRTAYSNRDFRRAVTTLVAAAPRKAVSANGRLSFEVALAPGEAWHACLLYALEDGKHHFRAPRDCVEKNSDSRHSETMTEWLKTVVKIETSNEEFYRLFRQALEDMSALRLPIRGTNHMVFIPAAGSNPGHCLWSGIVPSERAKRVVDRLMAPDMWTG
jgi:glycogen debranching enzyme